MCLSIVFVVHSEKLMGVSLFTKDRVFLEKLVVV